MSNIPFTQRLGAFKQRFQQVLGNRGSGYDELAQLEQPLVGDDSNYGAGDNYERSHGVSRPPQYSNYSGMGGGGAHSAASQPGHAAQIAQTIPSQVGPLCADICHVHNILSCDYMVACSIAHSSYIQHTVIAAGGRVAAAGRTCVRCCWLVVGTGCHARYWRGCHRYVGKI